MNIERADVLRITGEDASRTYTDLSVYRVDVELDGDVWKVIYLPADPFTVGGGPQYVVSAATGKILSRSYEQ